MKCNKCGINNSLILNKIIDANGIKILCPNCMCIELAKGNLDFTEDMNIIDDIKNTKGAVIFESSNEKYYLKKDTMLRLIGLNLLPNEYFALVKKYNSNQYMIHDDFYTEEGIAIQPVIESTTHHLNPNGF